MTIPTGTNYPTTLDTEENLFVVHDSLRMQLSEDYTPGDTSVSVNGDILVMANFPSSGLITLTDQNSEIDDRALSFFYSSRTETTFDGLELLSGFTDIAKPKRITSVTSNVMAKHHNNVKDAIIAIEEFVGVKGTTDTTPLGDTLEGRVNFLTKLVLTPKAWFSVNKRVGLVPLEVTFTDESFRIGRGDVTYIWDFGDQTLSGVSTFSLISATSVVPLDEPNVVVQDLDGGTIKKVYTQPGKYDVKLTVINENGQDTVEFKELINPRVAAPQEAVIDFVPRTGQITTTGDPIGGPYTTPPTIRASINSFIDLTIADGENPSNLGYSYGGEQLNGSGSPIDPIATYTWGLSDDLVHINSQSAKASYSIGGIYDLKLRVDTSYGAYRITTYENAIDVVEKTNLWLWTFTNSTTVLASEFGLISETFKVGSPTLTVTRDDGFLDGTNNEEQAKREFYKNTGFAPRSTTKSGDSGTALLFWASGGPDGGSLLDHNINVVEFQGFNTGAGAYVSQPDISSHPWNWMYLDINDTTYFTFGQNPTASPGTNPSYPVKTSYDLTTLASTDTPLTTSSYSNGADELESHVSIYESGVPTNGYFAVYRSATKDNVGFFLRNDSVGSFFRIKSFYKTEGTISDPFLTITKLSDITGTTKVEGELVELSSGVFFFDNSGNISAYNDSSSVWETGGPSAGSIAFRAVQDKTIDGYDSLENTLLAASDSDKTVYLSYDYSTSAFIKFNATDLTYTSLGTRTSGEQWLMGVY